MKSLIGLIVAALLVTGCASSSKTYTADGKGGHVLNCSGAARTWGMCYEKAGELCGRRGYVVEQKTGDENTVVTASPKFASGISTHTRSMLVRCK